MTLNNSGSLERATSRRGSVLALGGTALAAALSGVLGAAAKPKDGRQAKKQCKAKCRAQVGQCQTVIDIACAVNDDPESCRQRVLPCCDRAATCNAGAMLSCVLAGGVQP